MFPRTRPRKLLFISLEFQRGCFSGNGVYAQSQVRSLRSLGHEVLVLAGCPEAATQDGFPPAADSVDLIEVPCPNWGRLDVFSGWREFAEGAAIAAVTAAVVRFKAEAVLGVDWHALPAWQALTAGSLLQTSDTRPLGATPYIYLNYRVYTRTAAGDTLPVVRRLERDAVAAAAAVICLSRSDSQYILSHLLGEEVVTGASNASMGAESPALPANGDVRPCAPTACAAGGPPVSVLLPALRSDMEQIPLPPDVVSAGIPSMSHPAGSNAPGPQPGTSHARCQHRGTQRRYLTCCVRLSPEKEADRFVALVEALSRPSPKAAPLENGFEVSGEPRSQLEALKLVPLMCGAATTDYGKTLHARLLAAVPSAVIESRFLPPTELAKVFAATKLNVHPCVYDAYGMTVVEAASQGAPSVVMAGGAVGASDLLSSTAGECFAVDMGSPPEQLAAAVEKLLQDEEALAATGVRAAARARSWTETANASSLMQTVDAVLLART